MTGAGAVEPEIVTEGSGSVERTADQADLHLRYTTTAPTRTDAVGELNRRAAEFEPLLRHAAVQVRYRRLHVLDEWRGRRIVGGQAVQELGLRVTDVAAMAEVLAAVIDTEPATLYGPEWLLDDRAAAYREAQRLAVEDARTHAEGFAAALGGRIGPLLALSELTDFSSMSLHAASPSAAGENAAGLDIRALRLDPEPVKVNSRCTTRWTLITQS